MDANIFEAVGGGVLDFLFLRDGRLPVVIIRLDWVFAAVLCTHIESRTPLRDPALHPLRRRQEHGQSSGGSRVLRRVSTCC